MTLRSGVQELMGGYIFADGRTRTHASASCRRCEWFPLSFTEVSVIYSPISLYPHIFRHFSMPLLLPSLVMSKGGMREDGGRGTLVSRGDNGSLLVRSDAQHSCEFLSLRHTHTSPFASSHLFKKNLPQYLYPNPHCALSRRLQVTKDSLSTWRGGEG